MARIKSRCERPRISNQLIKVYKSWLVYKGPHKEGILQANLELYLDWLEKDMLVYGNDPLDLRHMEDLTHDKIKLDGI